MTENRRSFFRKAVAAVGLAPLAGAVTAVDLPTSGLFRGGRAWLYVRVNDRDPDPAPYRMPGRFTIYWKDAFRMQGPARAVYNIPASQVDRVLHDLLANPAIPYRRLVAGIRHAAFADEAQEIEWLGKPPASRPRPPDPRDGVPDLDD